MKRFMAVIGVTALLLALTASPAAAATLQVDDDGLDCPGAQYSSIQDAVDAASNGDRIQVCEGDYFEDVVVDKRVKLFAQPAATSQNGPGAFVNGSITIEANNASVEGFVVDNSTSANEYGIGIFGANRASILKNFVVSAQFVGLVVFDSRNGLVEENVFFVNGIPEFFGPGGIALVETNGYKVLRNLSFVNIGSGIVLLDSDNNLIRGNGSAFNGADGISLCSLEGNGSQGNTLKENGVFANGDLVPGSVGLFVCEDSGDNTFKRNDLFGNPLDVQDETSGGGTAGTDNLYLDNSCDTSEPFGLCQGGPDPASNVRQPARLSRNASGKAAISALLRR
jgi:nitrous oxidase accessory protein NosD